MRESHCEVRHQHFSSDRAGDRHVPYCTSDPVVTSERLRVASTKGGTLLFEQVDRKSGLTWQIRNKAAHYRSSA